MLVKNTYKYFVWKRDPQSSVVCVCAYVDAHRFIFYQFLQVDVKVFNKNEMKSLVYTIGEVGCSW